MKILEFQAHVVILSTKECTQIKGGSDGQDSSNVLIIEDIDII